MRLRYKFIIQNVSGKNVAVVVGRDAEQFHGMIKLNDSGALVFKLLSDRDLTQNQLLTQFAEQCGTSVESIQADVLEFVDQLRQNGLLIDERS